MFASVPLSVLEHQNREWPFESNQAATASAVIPLAADMLSHSAEGPPDWPSSVLLKSSLDELIFPAFYP